MKPLLLTAFVPRSSKSFRRRQGQSGVEEHNASSSSNHNSSLCTGGDVATLRLAAHDGDFIHTSPTVAVAGCPKAKKRKHKAKHHAKRSHRRAHHKHAQRRAAR